VLLGLKSQASSRDWALIYFVVFGADDMSYALIFVFLKN
jgi:hypothetical protein